MKTISVILVLAATQLFLPGCNELMLAGSPQLQLHDKPQMLSTAQAKVVILAHDFFHARWNQGGGGTAHQYKTSIVGDFPTVLDQATGLMWQRVGSGQPQTNADAIAYIKTLNANKSGGFDDWRLPTLEEAMSLMTSPEHGQAAQVTTADTSQRPVYHIDRALEISGAYFVWTADLESSKRAWVVYFLDGVCTPESLQFNAYVRAVRTSVPLT